MKKIGIIGYGNMGRSIAECIRSKYALCVFDQDKNKINGLKNIAVANNLAQLVKQAEMIILAVKPQDFDRLLAELKGKIKEQLIISIAAGITTGYIQRALGKVRVMRAMPNIGAKIACSVTCLCKGSLALNQDLKKTKDLFSNIGKVGVLDEKLMNAATAISGSGPGYYFNAAELRYEEYIGNRTKFKKDFILALALAAEKVGFNKKTAKFLAHWTVIYSDLLQKKTNLSVGDLKDQVTSRGGTTEAALAILEAGGSLVNAVRAAVRRAKELSRG